jgi:hypothetical protein
MNDSGHDLKRFLLLLNMQISSSCGHAVSLRMHVCISTENYILYIEILITMTVTSRLAQVAR